MDRLAKLVAALFASGCGLAHAFYAQVSPASVFSAASDGTVMYRAAANDVISGGIARVSAGAALTIGGEAITMPVAARFAADAAIFAARGAWPLLIAGIAAPIVINWFEGQGVSVQNGVVSVTDPSVCTVAPCYQYQWGSDGWQNSVSAVCSQISGQLTSNPTLRFGTMTPSGSASSAYCSGPVYNASSGAFVTNTSAPLQLQAVSPSSSSFVPISEPDLETKMSSVPLPDNLPQALPVPLPVLQPVLNPDASGNPQPLWVPQGNPVPVPSTSPQQYSQPGTRITPQPSPSSPWQVDVAPDDKISTDPSPVLTPQAVPPADAASAPSSTQPTDICQLHPDIVACQGLGTLDPVTLPDRPVSLSITPDSGWGAGAGSCPAPQTFAAMGATYSLSFQPICNFGTGIRPVVIGLAWLSAALIMFGVARSHG